MKPKHIKSLQSQSRRLQAKWAKDNTIEVQSLTNPEEKYTVTFRFGEEGKIHADCTCPWAQHNGVGCSHVMAAMEHLAQRKGRRLSFWITRADAQRQKQRTFYLEGEGAGGIWITSRAG